MTDGPQRIITLKEYDFEELPIEALNVDTAQKLADKWKAQVGVERLWQGGERWKLTASGTVGYLPVDATLHIALEPKVSIENLFGMMEYAYKVGRFLEGLVDLDNLRDVYERLARVLARRVLDRARQGLYRAYLAREERSSFVRGRLNTRRLAQAPWDTRLACRFQDHTTDVEENRILTWTLFIVARSGICGGEVLPLVRRAYRQMSRTVSCEPMAAACCVGRSYHRLNEDYRSLHALCRFFLDHCGPAHRRGDRAMLPFLIDMARLYETFVAQWLIAHCSNGVAFRPHHRFTWDTTHNMWSDVDLTMHDETEERTTCVLDTKYKAGQTPEESDVHQIVFYAQQLGCHEAVLIYPMPLASPIDAWIDDIHLRTLSFPIDGDLDEGGKGFLSALLEPAERF